jgi:hypothetical protein
MKRIQRMRRIRQQPKQWGFGVAVFGAARMPLHHRDPDGGAVPPAVPQPLPLSLPLPLPLQLQLQYPRYPLHPRNPRPRLFESTLMPASRP